MVSFDGAGSDAAAQKKVLRRSFVQFRVPIAGWLFSGFCSALWR